jgi:hypothetical protein
MEIALLSGSSQDDWRRSLRTKEAAMRQLHIDRSAIAVCDLYDDQSERQDWWSKSPNERMVAMELMRQIAYEYNPVADRIPRILEVLNK